MRTVAIWLLLCAPCWAAPVGNDYLCVQGHEQDATTKLQRYATQAITNFFKARNIAIDSSTLQASITLTIQPGSSGASFAGFTGAAGNGGNALAGSSIAATVAAQDGTKFNVLFSSGSDVQDMGEYRVVSRQRRFDREGNAIDRHCILRLFNSGDLDATRTLLVINAGSGHVLGLIRLPTQINVY